MCRASTNQHSQNNNCIWCQIENNREYPYNYSGASCTNRTYHSDSFVFNITNYF